MDEQNDVWSVLENFQKGFRLLSNRLDQQDQLIQEYKEQNQKLEDILYDGIINPATDAYNGAMRDNRFDEFNDKYGEKLGGYNDALKSIEGDDFDLAKTAFDEYDALEDKPDSDKWVDALTSSLDDQLSRIREAVGAGPNADVEITQDAEGGEPEVTVDGEPVDPAVLDETAEEEPVEEDVPVEEEDEILDDEDIPVESDEEDLDALEKDAEEALNKAGKLPGRG